MVLEMIGHIRKPHWVNVEEPEPREERADEKQQSNDRPLSDAVSGKPEDDNGEDQDHWEQILPPDMRIDMPSRVDEAEMCR